MNASFSMLESELVRRAGQIHGSSLQAESARRTLADNWIALSEAAHDLQLDPETEHEDLPFYVRWRRKVNQNNAYRSKRAFSGPCARGPQDVIGG